MCKKISHTLEIYLFQDFNNIHLPVLQVTENCRFSLTYESRSAAMYITAKNYCNNHFNKVIEIGEYF